MKKARAETKQTKHGEEVVVIALDEDGNDSHQLAVIDISYGDEASARLAIELAAEEGYLIDWLKKPKQQLELF
jgi:hypothetical protein